MSSDLTLKRIDIIRLYGFRFKIEFGFKQAAHVIGSYEYQFRMMSMEPQTRKGGNQYLHRESCKYRQDVRDKLHNYHVYLFMGFTVRRLMHCLVSCYTDQIWKSFGSWMRTIRQGVTQ